MNDLHKVMDIVHLYLCHILMMQLIHLR